MPRRLRRPAALLALLVVPTGMLAACGSDTSGNGFELADRLEAVSVEGEVGSAPTVEWEQRMKAAGVESETLVEGDGEALVEGETVFVNFLLANGYTRETAIDTFGEEAAGVSLEVGGEPVQPNAVNDLVQAFLLEQLDTDVTRGSRLAFTGDTAAIFGEYAQSPVLAEENIGNADGLLVVADVLDVEVLDGPEGEQSSLPGWAPTIQFKNGQPTGFDFEGLEEPPATLVSHTLKKGTGETVEKGDLMTVSYLGQVYDGAEPFDENYSAAKNGPTPLRIGLGEVVPGWDKKLVGETVGSRVLLRIPPKDGYGKQAQGEAIPANSTLYFVVDILASI